MDKQLPLEILIEIACESIEAFRAMLALRPVVEFLRCNRKWILSKFSSVVIVKQRIEYRIRDKIYSDETSVLEWSNGTKEWRRNDLKHRDGDLPAIEHASGSKEWCRDGKRHRDNDLPAIITHGGSKCWYRNGLQHRDGDLPAVDWPGKGKSWWKNNVRHRDNSLPAVERCNGNNEYWVNGIKID